LPDINKYKAKIFIFNIILYGYLSFKILKIQFKIVITYLKCADIKIRAEGWRTISTVKWALNLDASLT